MASNYWIKVYHEVLHDPKMGRLSDHLWRRFFEMCLAAGERDIDGTLPAVADLAWNLRTTAEELEADLVELSRDNLVHCEDGIWIVTQFVERQSQMSAKERQARKRERDKKLQYYGHEPVTNRDTDKDIDKDIDLPPVSEGVAAEQPPGPADAGASRTTPGNGRPRAPTESQAMFTALADFYRLDTTLLTTKQRAHLNATGKRIRDSGKTTAEVEAACVHWYTSDWRGKQGQPPANDSQVFEALAAVTKAAPRASPPEAVSGPYREMEPWR